MRKAFKISVIAFTCMVGALTALGSAAWGEEQKERVMIGRISFVEGQLLRYVYEEQDWVAIVKDAPFGLDDALYSDQQSHAEFIMPNNTWIRIGGSTQIQMLSLKPDITEVDVASGMARFYNKGDSAVIKVTTPFGDVVAYGGTAFDVYVGDTSVEVLSIEGTVDFLHQADGTRYEVVAGGSSILADEKETAQGDGLVDADWDDWNQGRDQAWQKRIEVKGDSYEYLPSSLQYEADVFEENGKWEEVDYQGERRRMWRPTRVSSSWAPYTDGRWSVYYGDNCWIPDEPFGYTTHHYGSWVRVESCGCWYWAPPVRRSVVHVERRYETYDDDCDCDWYPGRVAWIHSQQEVGWIPLTPSEPYYTNHFWGGLSVVVSSVASVAVNIASYHNYHHAVVVNQNNFYNVNNYNNVRITNINNTTIINNYRGAAVVNNTVINNFNVNRNRYNFTNVNVQRAPHESIVRRIERNQGLARETRTIGAADISRNLSGFRAGTLDPSRRVSAPRVSNRLVDRNDVRRPITDMQLPQREVRQRGRQAVPVSDRILPGRESRQGRAPRGMDIGTQGASSPTREGLAAPGLHGPRQDLQQGQQGRAGQGETGRTGLRPVRPDLRRDGREAVPGGPDQGSPGQTDRGTLRPVRPGFGRDRIGSDQGTADQAQGGQTVRPGIRPVRPGLQGDQGATDQGAQGLGDRSRIRSPRSGSEQQVGGTEGASQSEPGGRGLRPVRPGRAGEDQGTAQQGSQGLGDRSRIRPPRFGQDAQPDTTPAGSAAGSDRNGLRPVRPGSDGQTGGSSDNLRDQRRQQLLDQRQQMQDQRQRQQDLRGPQQNQQQQDPGQSRRQQMDQQRQEQQQRRQQIEQQRQQQQEQSRQQAEQQRQQQMQQRQQQDESRRQQMEQQRQQQLQRQQQAEQQRQQQMQQRQQQMEQQKQQQQQQQQQQRQQQMEQQRQQQQQQQQQRQQQAEQQRQQQMQQRQQQMEQQKQQQQQQRQQQMEQQRQQQQQLRQQQAEQQRQQQMQQRQQQMQQQQQQRQQQLQQQQQLRQQQQQQKKRGQQDPNQVVQ